MVESSLVLGLANEERDSALRQVSLWDDMTVGAGLQRAFLRRLRRSGDAHSLQSTTDGALADTTQWPRDFHRPLDPHAMKLCRLLNHLQIPIDAPPTAGGLHVDGEKIERKAISAARAKDVDDLVRRILCRVFTDLDACLSKAPLNERERVVKQIADALDHMGDDLRERVRQHAKLDDLSRQTLTRVGALAALGVGSTGVGGAGFAAYTTLNATIAAISGLVGVTLPFSVYVTVTSLLAFATNPLVVMGVAVGGGTWLVKSANRRMQAELLPLLVAFAAANAEGTAEERSRVRELARHLADRYQEFRHGGPKRRDQLLRAFPAFGAP